MKLSLSAARRLAIRHQGLDGGWALAPGKEGIVQAVERLGYVQIDTINVVERAHHHVLWCRCPDYDTEALHALQAHDRRVFEYWHWGSVAAYLPMSDYRYSLPRMRAHAESARTRHWLAENEAVVQEVLARIRAEGPLPASAFEAPPGFQRGTWWSWKPAKHALETLFSMGVLLVAERRAFQRVYDLAERVLPPDLDLTPPTDEEMRRHMVRRTLSALGILPQRGHAWWANEPNFKDSLAELVATGEATLVEVEDESHIVPSAALAELDAPFAHTCHILSPFDGLVISRRRLQQLFGFDYRIECYTPAAQRRYGYFSLPVLWGEQFVARLDAKADRKARALLVRNVVFEPAESLDETLWPALATRLGAYAAFNGCERVELQAADPPAMGLPLLHACVAAGVPTSATF